jgi:DNA-binding GntR family transcriptional regulator
VLAAIERRDGEEARRRMVAHVLRAGDLVVRRFEDRAAFDR